MADTPAVNEPVVADTTSTDSAPVEQKTEVVKDDLAEANESVLKSETDSKAEPDKTEEAKTEETDTKEQPQGKAEERKQQLTSEIRDLVSQRNALRTEVEKINGEVYQPATEQELVDQGMSDLEAKVEAMRQQGEVEKYNTAVADAQLTVESESSRVLNDFPIFDPGSEDFKPEIAAQSAQLLESNLIKDPNTGQVIGSHVSPYQLYKTIAAAHQSSATEGQIKGQQDTEEMLARVDSPSSAAPSKDKSDDPFLKGLLGET